jgi:isopentenyl-diphosphate Delta-isomerase
MSEDIFDIVNNYDEVIGRLPRSIVHRYGHKHRAVHVLVFDSRGGIFLQKRSMAKDTYPGAWDSSSSGHLESGEDYDTAARRELGEEIGLTPSGPLEPLFKIAACAETGAEFVRVYRCESEGPFILQASEIERGDWFTSTEVTDWIARRPEDFAPSFILIWKKWLNKT